MVSEEMSTEPDYSEIYELEPESFDLLDLAEEVFKHSGEFSFGINRNDSIARNGTNYNEIEREWEQLKDLYHADPEHTVEPMKPVYREENGEKEVIGFYMERVNGWNMQDTLKNSKKINENLKKVQEIQETVKNFHEQGVVHGDLANNIIEYEDGFKVYDPVGKPYSEADKMNMEDWDNGDIERLMDKAKMPFNF